MGIFIKFECDTCGEYECDCPYEKRNISKPPPVHKPIPPHMIKVRVMENGGMVIKTMLYEDYLKLKNDE